MKSTFRPKVDDTVVTEHPTTYSSAVQFIAYPSYNVTTVLNQEPPVNTFVIFKVDICFFFFSPTMLKKKKALR